MKNVKKWWKKGEFVKIIFVTTVPESDIEGFKYINTPQSFEENIKTIIENGYTIISMTELDKVIDGKMDIPEKPVMMY